jgi:lipopolysaccharide transport system ATP-binding protein
MQNNVAIEIDKVYKQYKLGSVGTGTLSHDLNRWWHKIRGKEDPYEKITSNNDRSDKGSTNDYVWALQDISFDIKKGEVIGIIGKNGAGKSTMLKILSKVTSPTKGNIKVNGRIASLLEVGTGFHPELSGRENVFLNGAILGLTKNEIKRKFDEIVAFSGVDKYIDTPVKRYSSGMYVRLAFGVAAHLESEILIVDEVLAVGDAEFQKKCLGKMKDVSNNEGRTVLFVSHNMPTMQNLCTSAVFMEKGKLKIEKSDTSTIIQHYLQDGFEKAKTNIADRTDRQGEGNIRITGFYITDENGNMQNEVMGGQKIIFNIKYKCKENFTANGLSVALSVTRNDAVLMSVFCNEYTQTLLFNDIKNEGLFQCTVDNMPFMKGEYLLNFMLNRGNIIEDWIIEGSTMQVEDGDFYGTGKIIESSHRSLLINHSWKNA